MHIAHGIFVFEWNSGGQLARFLSVCDISNTTFDFCSPGLIHSFAYATISFNAGICFVSSLCLCALQTVPRFFITFHSCWFFIATTLPYVVIRVLKVTMIIRNVIKQANGESAKFRLICVKQIKTVDSTAVSAMNCFRYEKQHTHVNHFTSSKTTDKLSTTNGHSKIEMNLLIGNSILLLILVHFGITSLTSLLLEFF